MKIKLLCFSLVLLATGGSLFAQRPISIVGGVVTANVADTSDFQVILSANVTGVTLVSTTGTSNNAVTPSTGYQVTMRFVQDATGSRTVVFGGNISTSCTVNATALSVTICRWQYTASGNTWADSGSGSGSTAAALPATCTPGTTANVNLVINGTGYGPFYCSTTNTWSPDNPTSRTVSPLAYGAKWDVKFTYGAQFTSGSGVVTCAVGDCNFQCPGGVYPCSTAGVSGTDVGKIAFGTLAPAGVNGTPTTTLEIAQTTIASVQSLTQATTTATSAGNCTPSSSQICAFAWGTQDDATAINSAAAAAWGTPGYCYAEQLPTGAAFFGGPILNLAQTSMSAACAGTVNSTSGADTNQTGPEVYGQGPGNTVLIPLPNYNFAGCTFTAYKGASLANSNTCNGSAVNLEAHDFGINGLGQGLTGNPQAVTLWGMFGSFTAFCTGSTAFNLTFSSWGMNSTGSIGVGLGHNSCGAPTYSNIVSEMFGAQNCQVDASATVVTVITLACFGSTIAPAVFTSAGGTAGQGGIINSYGGYYAGNEVSGPAIDFLFSNTGQGQNSFIFNSKGDFIDQQFTVAGGTAIQVGASGGGIANFDGDNILLISSNSSTSQVFFLNGSTSSFNVHVRNSTITATGANNRTIFSASTNNIFDDGGNTWFPGTLANSISGQAFGFTNSANGTACATGNFALTSGWGTSSVASVAANGNILGCHVSVTGAAGSAGPVLTWTYPAVPIVAPSSCHISGGAFGTLTGAQSGTPGATTVAFTFTGTPSAQTYTFDVGCP
jgi:hypothetical protein